MKVGIGNDHAAVELKMQIKEFIESMGHEVVNYGVDTAESCNYPEIPTPVPQINTAQSTSLYRFLFYWFFCFFSQMSFL